MCVKFPLSLRNVEDLLHADAEGSIIGWSDGAANSGGVFSYGPYGERSTWTGPRYAYTGQIELPEAQLYSYKARIYDPVRGWFLQTDPVGYDADFNLYEYARSDPANNADPSGTRNDGPFSAGIGTSALAGLAVSNVQHAGDSVASTGSTASAAVPQGQQVQPAGPKSPSSTSAGRTTTITHADGTQEARTGTPAFRDNNLGNIHPGDFTRAHGQIGVDPGTKGVSGPFAVFENTAAGRAALSAMVATPQVGSRTIEQ